MHVTVRNLNKFFGPFQATDNVSFEIEQGKLVGLLGPSGGGKTTILRLLAGLELPDSGEILFEGANVNQLTPQQRGIGFVFQNYALFRHMSVFDNIAFGLTVRRRSKRDIRERVGQLIELTGLQGLERRLPHQLSGGQRQRVAFARALAPEPRLLLLDEPFAAIDAKVRKELRTWLREMIRRVGVTTIFVTHDQEEAIEVSDELMIVHRGRVEQKGTPEQIYRTPQTAYVASFIGESAHIDALSELKGFDDEHPGTKAIVRPEFLEIGRPGEILMAHAAQPGTVKNAFFRGSYWQLEVEIGSHTLAAYRSLEKDPIRAGENILVLVHRLFLYDDNGTRLVENKLKFDPMPVHI